jgi:hypothetical protein
MEEKRRQMSKEMSLISVEINEMISTKSKTKTTMIRNSCNTTSSDITAVASVDEYLVGLQIPSFEPVYSFSQIKSHTADQDEVTPEEDEEVAPVIKHAKVISVKTVKILSPIQEEESDNNID